MMPDDRTTQLIAMLLSETEKGALDWQAADAPSALVSGTESQVPLYLGAYFKGKYFGVYDLRTKSFYDEHDYYWYESIGFCITDINNRVLWESREYNQVLLDLFNAAREQASGINDIFHDLLGH